MTQTLPADLTANAAAYLLAQTSVTDVVGTQLDGVPMIYQDALAAVVEGTSMAAIVVSTQGGWFNDDSTWSFPRLSVEVWADPDRDQEKNILSSTSARKRAVQALSAVEDVLHCPEGGTRSWGTMRVVLSLRLTQPLFYPVPDGEGMVRGQTFFAVVEG